MKNSKTCFLIPLLAMLIGGSVVTYSHSAFLSAAPVLRTAVALGGQAPGFRLKDLSGDTITLERYRGVVVMVNFWATWCGPCRVEMPAMESLYKMFPRKDFEILAVSTDAQGAVVTRPFRQELGLSFPILHDPDFQIARLYGAHLGLPVTFLLDRQGVIRHRIPGALDWQAPQAVELVARLIREGRS